MNWTELDWPALERLRDRFLRADPAEGSYWRTTGELESYDQTYGERIGWKWDAVFRELELRGWKPRSRTIVDWGCGSGIAARRVVRWLGPESVSQVILHDHSPVALDFATARMQQEFPRVPKVRAGAEMREVDSIGLLLISHVLNELPPPALEELRRAVLRAREVIWVESGTHIVSRQLGKIRDELLPEFRMVAPCTHQNPCPMFRPENLRHWCHFFARPPSEIFADSDWVKFGQRAGIDLRSLPYAFFAASRSVGKEALDPSLSRVIGRPETFKPYVRFLNCDEAGLAPVEVEKRSAPQLFKQLSKTQRPLVYRWSRVDGKIVRGDSPLSATAPDPPPEVP